MDRSEQPPPGPGLINPTPDANCRAADQTQEMIGHRETLARQAAGFGELAPGCRNSTGLLTCAAIPQDRNLGWWPVNGGQSRRSEEHTPELQSLMCTSYAVFCSTKQ